MDNENTEHRLPVYGKALGGPQRGTSFQNEHVHCAKLLLTIYILKPAIARTKNDAADLHSHLLWCYNTACTRLSVSGAI